MCCSSRLPIDVLETASRLLTVDPDASPAVQLEHVDGSTIAALAPTEWLRRILVRPSPAGPEPATGALPAAPTRTVP